MSSKLHPFVQKTKVELERLDKQKKVSLEQWRKFSNEFLPIHTELKLRRRALKFMDTLIKKLEQNNHGIKFEYKRCYIEMYGQLTEINLRQKYFRKRIKDSYGYGTNTYEKSNKLEFQVGSYARKSWIDRKTKNLEDYLEVIYDFIDKDSIEWAELRKKQKTEEEKEEIQRNIDTEIALKKDLERVKLEKLFFNSENYDRANKIRTYLLAYKAKFPSSNSLDNEIDEYLTWGFKKADELDPLS